MMTDDLFSNLLAALREGAEMLRCCGERGHLTYTCQEHGIQRLRCLRCGAVMWTIEAKREPDAEQ
jgi:hypothetical protein